MEKILILTAGFGEGHNAAARNLRDAIEHVTEDAKVEVLDLFESSYGAFNTFVKRAYLGMVQHTPALWGGIYSILDQSSMVESQLGGFTRLRNALGDVLNETQPDCVVSTYPVYAHVIRELYKDHASRPFRFITIVTDSITVNSAWFRAPSDIWCVPNDATAQVMMDAGVPSAAIQVTGFPVTHWLTQPPPQPLQTPEERVIRRVLYIINTGKKKAGKVIDRILEMPDLHLTITAGRDARLKAELLERTAQWGDRVTIFGWTNLMPQLMQQSHVVVTKAGGATVQEAIAARCPMIINQVIPGQEEGNARLVQQYGLGAVAARNREVPELIESAFDRKAKRWLRWRDNLAAISKPDAALRIAEIVLATSDSPPDGNGRPRLFELASPVASAGNKSSPSGASMLLCDFHIHSNYSDGKLTVSDVVDFYGRRGFDCICITDHLADPRRVIGKLSKLTNLVLGENQLDEYFDVLDRERRRAWRKYNMLVMTGIEFNKDGFTKKSSAHLLGIDLRAPIAGALDLPETIAQIHAQGGLAVASHPHVMKSEWGKTTLHLWENQDTYAPLLDA